MPHMNGGQALIHSLKREGIRTVFGIPGAGQYEAIDALYTTPEIQYISVRNEQAATFMADAYARVSGEIAAVLLVPGPGFYNAAGGMASAQTVSSPMLVITGSRRPSTAGYQSDELVLMSHLSKWSSVAHATADIPKLVQQAMHQARTGRPQPVGLEISPQIFATTDSVELLDPLPAEPLAPDSVQVEKAARLVCEAEQPLLWVGAGIHRAEAQDILLTLVEHLQIPVVSSNQGKGAISDRHPLSLGTAELRFAPLRRWIEGRDLLVVVGTDVDVGFFDGPVIRIDVDSATFAQTSRTIGICADARAGLASLMKILETSTPNQDVRAEAVQTEVRAINMERFKPDGQLHPQWELMIAIRNALPDDAVLAPGVTQMGYYSRNYFPVFSPRTYLTASAYATLGCAYPMALGAKVAMPERTVVAISGDGGFLYNAQEMATAVQYGINVVGIVFNDNAYGNVLRAQQEEFDGHVIGTRLHNPDFIKLAQAYGVHGILADGHEQLEVAIIEAIHCNEPTLIEVPVGPMERVY